MQAVEEFHTGDRPGDRTVRTVGLDVMDPIPQAFLTLGCVLLVGLVADLAGARTGVPRVTLLLVLGFGIGPGGLDLLPPITQDWFPVISTLALTMVGFLLGAEARAERLRLHGAESVIIALVQGLTTAAVVIFGLLVAGAGTTVALTLGGIAIATAPAATIAVVQERQADGPFTRTLLAIVAFDDVIALTLFGLLATLAAVLDGSSGGRIDLLGEALWEVFGAVGLGVGLGLPAAALTGRIRPGRPTQEEAYGLVLVAAGLALWLEVSFLLAAVALGATVANRAAHHETPFHEIERIEWPALVVFFVLAGAALELGALGEVGLIGSVYVLCRLIGKILGCVGGARIVRKPQAWGRWLGAAMLPQAGVAIGLTLLAAERFPEVADELIPLVIAATVIFELTGPVAATLALERVGEAEPRTR